MPSDRRLNITQIKDHPWMKGYTLPSYLQPKVPVNLIDMILVEKIASLGFKVDEIVVSLALNKNTQTTSIYHLLVKRFNLRVEDSKKNVNSQKQSKRVCAEYKKTSTSDTSLLSKKYSATN